MLVTTITILHDRTISLFTSPEVIERQSLTNWVSGSAEAVSQKCTTYEYHVSIETSFAELVPLRALKGIVTVYQQFQVLTMIKSLFIDVLVYTQNGLVDYVCTCQA